MWQVYSESRKWRTLRGDHQYKSRPDRVANKLDNVMEYKKRIRDLSMENYKKEK